jgi:hypothetical protein
VWAGARLKQRRREHDPGRVIRDLEVMLADGGKCVSDLSPVCDQQALFGAVASDSTAFRVLDRIASEGLSSELRVAHARAVLEAARDVAAVDDRHRRDVDLRSLRQGAGRRHLQGGCGLRPLTASADQTREAVGAPLRPGNGGANTAPSI